MEFYIAYTGHERNARKLLLDGRIVDAKSKENRKVNKTTGKMIDLYPPIQQSEYSGSVVKTQIQSFYNEPIYVVEEGEGCSPLCCIINQQGRIVAGYCHIRKNHFQSTVQKVCRNFGLPLVSKSGSRYFIPLS